MKIDRKKLRLILLAVAIAAAGAVFYLAWNYTHAEDNAAKAEQNAAEDIDRTFTLKKGDLVLGITQPGTVSAKKKHRVVPQANVRSTIVWII